MSKMLSEIPDGSRVLVDTNILAYHQIQVPGLTQPSTEFLMRVEARSLQAIASTQIIAETVHKVMLAQAAAQHGFPQAGALNHLRRDRSLILAMQPLDVVDQLVRMGVQIEPIIPEDLRFAQNSITRYGLLTNDAITVAVMHRLQLTDIVSNDDDFDHVAWLTVWKPR